MDFSVFTPGNIMASVIGGVFAGFYLAIFHPDVAFVPLLRRSLLQTWYFGFLGSVLYLVRFGVAITAGGDSAPGRITAGWILWLLFSVLIGVGAAAGNEVHNRGKKEGS